MSLEHATSDTPLLSVLCLTYNHADFVATTLDSFLAQVTDFDFEIVISDDCSSDGTLEILEGYCARDSRIRILRTPVNLGVTRNFRRGMRACRGKYIALCEGDDFWRGTGKLQAQVRFLEEHPEFVLTYHDAMIVDASGETSISQLPRRLRSDASRAQLIATRPISTLTACFRNVLEDLPSELDQAPALDLCLWSLLGHHGQGKYLAAIEPAGYRVHAGGVFSMQTERNRYLMTAQSLLCLARVYGRLGKLDASEVVLHKAIQMAGIPLGSIASLRLLGANVVSLAAPALIAVIRRLRYRRGAADTSSPRA